LRCQFLVGDGQGDSHAFSRWRTVVKDSSSIIPTRRRRRAPTTRRTLRGT
jgi:hypothetical protein